MGLLLLEQLVNATLGLLGASEHLLLQVHVERFDTLLRLTRLHLQLERLKDVVGFLLHHLLLELIVLLDRHELDIAFGLPKASDHDLGHGLAAAGDVGVGVDVAGIQLVATTLALVEGGEHNWGLGFGVPWKQ